MILWNRSPELGITEDWFSTAQYFDIKSGHRGFEEVAAIGEIDPELPVYNVRTMADRLAGSLAHRRFSMIALSLFAALALGLSLIGIYGVIAGLVAQGTRELGIRMALGANPRQIRALVVGQGLPMVLAGLTLGLASAFALTRFMRGLLFAVVPADPLTFSAIALLLGATALAATYVPARRAARIDPIESLRSDQGWRGRASALLGGFPSAPAHRLVILGLAVTATAGLLAAAMHLVDRGPRPAFGFLLGQSALFVAFFDVLGLTLLLVGVFFLASLRHSWTSAAA